MTTSMQTGSNTLWGQEFEGIRVEAGQDDAGEDGAWGSVPASLRAGLWDDALERLAVAYAQVPARGVEAMELASCIHLVQGNDLRGAVARARFAVGHVGDSDPWDALATVLSERLRANGDAPWAALALLDHTEGPSLLAEQTRSGEVEQRWVAAEGLDALEALVFTRADETQDAGWVALSALLAARDSSQAFDEEITLRASRRSSEDNTRAWGVELQVLFSLDHDDAAENLVDQALVVFGDNPRALLELLDTTNMDPELDLVIRALRRQKPKWVATRGVATRGVATRPREVGISGHNVEGFVRAIAGARNVSPGVFQGGLILRDAPRRTDEEWLERKQGGDKAFMRWLYTRSYLAMIVLVVAWVLFQTYF